MSRHENIAHEEEYRGCTIKLIYDNHAESPREGYDLGTMVCWHGRYILGDEQPKRDPQEYLREIARNYCFKERRALEERSNTAKRRVAEWDYQWDRALDAAFGKREDEILAKALQEHFVILPLYLYDHSGITMSTGPFGCPWDSGQVGFIYCSLESARKQYLDPDATWDSMLLGTTREGENITLRDAAVRRLEAEVRVYDAYLTGQVVGFVAEDWDEEEIDSCWGFYPDEDGEYSEAICQAKASIDYHIEKYGEKANLNEAEH